ncbi:cysteine desulfurase-like protein [Nocardioides sp.]|uniref:cysteine desulfurase-like protein n=1 Tax=Nocardioides sp. TaxID=35761 RepID=UPI003527293E
MAYDVAALRAQFPSLASGIAHFDGPGGTQTPQVVADAVARTLAGPLSNRGGLVASERNADDTVAAFRRAYADLLGVPATGIVYGRSATQLIYDVSRALAKQWSAGDEVVVTRLDHDADVRPWVQAAEARQVTVRWVDIDPGTADLDPTSLAEAITERTRLVAVTGASNLLGTRPDIPALGALAHRVGALLFVDGVHLAAHELVDVPAMGADLFVCSPYKFLGPHCGVLGGDPALLETLHPDKLLPATDAVPERFELGTLPYELMAGATAAVDFLAGLDGGDPSAPRRARLRAAFAAIHGHEERLSARLAEGLAGLGDAVVVHSVAAHRTPTTLLTLPGRSTDEAAEHLASRHVLAPSGTFYAYEPARRLGLGDTGGLRAGLAPYTDDDDVDRLLDGLATFLG